MSTEGPHDSRATRTRDGWILVLCLVSFGGLALTMFWQTFPRGWGGISRLALLLLFFLVAGGLLAPMLSKVLRR